MEKHEKWYQFRDANIIARFYGVIERLIKRYEDSFRRPDGPNYRLWANATSVYRLGNRRWGFRSGWDSGLATKPGGFPEGFDPYK